MNKKTVFKIAGRSVGDGQPVFIIAEVGVNHDGSVEKAKQLIDKAVEAGADAVKFQMCDPDEMVTKSAPKAEYQKKNKAEESQYDMLMRYYFDVPKHEELKAYAKKKGIIFFSTPFSLKDAHRLAKLGMPVWKVGSSDTNNYPQLRIMAKTGVPMLLSTGMSDFDEVKNSVAALKKAGNNKIVVLQCTTQYPAEDENTNLNAMLAMKKAFGQPVGYSDHTRGIEIALAAVALGACVIEKHITLDKTLPGPDHFASMEPQEFAALVTGIRRIEKAMGSSKKELTKDIKTIAKVARKSLVAAEDIKKGQKITWETLAYKRPGTGMPPPMADKIVGKRAKRDIARDTLLKPSDIA